MQKIRYMRLALLADEKQYAELMKFGCSPQLEIIRIPVPAIVEEADIYVDLLFDNSPDRVRSWSLIGAPVLFINAVEFRVYIKDQPIILINGWPGFLEREILEAGGRPEQKEIAEKLAGLLNRKLEWVKPVPGLVSARVISMIINEAYFTIGEEVTDETSVDTAMKLGTNYPYGPFEWAEKIGHTKINTLLKLLAEENARYQPAELLTRRAGS